MQSACVSHLCPWPSTPFHPRSAIATTCKRQFEGQALVCTKHMHYLCALPPVRDKLRANKYIKLNIFVHYLSALLLSAFRLNGRLMANTWVAKITQETLASCCTTTGVASRMDFFSKALSVWWDRQTDQTRKASPPGAPCVVNEYHQHSTSEFHK